MRVDRCVQACIGFMLVLYILCRSCILFPVGFLYARFGCQYVPNFSARGDH